MLLVWFIEKAWAACGAHERVHVRNVRDFPQAKPLGEINARFLLNEHMHDDIYFIV